MKRILQIITVLAAVFTVAMSAQQTGFRLVEAQTSQQPGNSITGRIVGDDGQPLSRALVYISSTRSAGFQRVEADETGGFRIDGLKPGSYTISASAPGYAFPRDRKYYHVGDQVFITMIRGGVITGIVTNSQGEPVTAVRVSAIRVTDSEGRPLHSPEPSTSYYTDDRGIYRIYGLLSGSYIVAANGMGLGYVADFIYKNSGPTYYPSSTSDTAEKVFVQSGQEVIGIDIRYRGDRGYTVSGTISGAILPLTHSVTLTDILSGVTYMSVFIRAGNGNNSFSISGVTDGQYELVARRVGVGDDPGAASDVRRIKVTGADVTGIDMRVMPLGAIAGNLILEPLQKTDQKDDCKGSEGRLLEEYVIQAHPEKNRNSKDKLRSSAVFSQDSSPDDKGDFLIRNLESRNYRLNLQLPSEDWYMLAITQSLDRSGIEKVHDASNGIAVKSGERVTGVSVTVAEGAGGLRGRVLVSQKVASLPSRLRVHLVPAEADQANHVLRYAETLMQSDGAFSFTNVAPGRYWIIARPASNDESSESGQVPLAWAERDRAALGREAGSKVGVIEIQPCQRITDHKLFYAPEPSKIGEGTLRKRL